MILFVLILLFIKVIDTELLETLDGNTNLELLFSRDIDYHDMTQRSPSMSAMIQQVFTDDQQKKLGLNYRFIVPHGKSIKINAMRLYPTIQLTNTEKTKSNDYLKEFNLTQYIIKNMIVDVKIYSSCRYFSSKVMKTNISVSFDDAINDWNDTIGSLAMPCKDILDINTNKTVYNSTLYYKHNVPFVTKIKDKLEWSYVYDISLFMLNDTEENNSGSFTVDAFNSTDMLLKSLEHYKLRNKNHDTSNAISNQVILMEPNAIWFDVEFKLPLLSTLGTLKPYINEEEFNLMLSYNNTNSNIISLSDHIYCLLKYPVWNTNKNLVLLYENINLSIDSVYNNEKYETLACTNVGVVSGITNTPFSENCQYIPFFLSGNYRDIYSQTLYAMDIGNFFKVNWNNGQCISGYDKYVYDDRGFYTCYERNSTFYGSTKGLFSLISQLADRPSVSYKIYGNQYTFDPNKLNNTNVDTTTTSHTSTTTATTTGTNFHEPQPDIINNTGIAEGLNISESTLKFPTVEELLKQNEIKNGVNSTNSSNVNITDVYPEGIKVKEAVAIGIVAFFIVIILIIILLTTVFSIEINPCSSEHDVEDETDYIKGSKNKKNRCSFIGLCKQRIYGPIVNIDNLDKDGIALDGFSSGKKQSYNNNTKPKNNTYKKANKTNKNDHGHGHGHDNKCNHKDKNSDDENCNDNDNKNKYETYEVETMSEYHDSDSSEEVYEEKKSGDVTYVNSGSPSVFHANEIPMRPINHLDQDD